MMLTEAKAQKELHHLLQGQVPIPEIFGWTEDAGQTFIYMELVEGVTLQERWPILDETDRLAICEELKHMVEAWRALDQGASVPYIGECASSTLNK